MTALPASIDFTDSSVTEANFKTAITNQRDFLSGLLGDDGVNSTALKTLGALGNDTLAKSSNYTVIATDRGVVFVCTSTFTLSLTAAATLADGFTFAVINVGTGIVTIDPSSTEQIDGANTKDIAAGSWAIVSCTGTAFYSMGAVPTTGALIGYQVFTSSGTYTKATNNPSFVIVEGTGGGGGATTSGGTTSFGSHISITGGNTNGNGGVGSGGDINVTGTKGDTDSVTEGAAIANGAVGTLYLYGSGAQETATIVFPAPSASAQGGGSSGYSKKKILASSLASSETVTIGAAGAGGAVAARAGIVIVWEYK